MNNKKIALQKYLLSRIGLGAMPLSITGRPSEKDAINIIETFLSLGGNFIDTANVYGLDAEDEGHNEILIYKALRRFNKIDEVLVATKGGATRPAGDWAFGAGHPKNLRKACEQSLINLNCATHSLYYLHGPDPKIPLKDSLGELIRLKKEGKINHIGLSNVTLDEVQIALKLTKITAVQNRFNPFCKEDLHNGLIRFCQTNEILYVPYCPLGGWLEHKQLGSSDLYKTLVERYQTSSFLIALAWSLAKGEHIIPIPGMIKKEQVIMNFAAFNLQLLSEDIKKIDDFPDLYLAKHI